MEGCLDRTDVPYVAIFENDIIAMPEWYYGSPAGHAKPELGFAPDHRGTDGILYLRLFYTKEILGWSSEGWREHARGRYLQPALRSWHYIVCACGALGQDNF
jgi:hypothetical protein